jgi:hypothetical protein
LNLRVSAIGHIKLRICSNVEQEIGASSTIYLHATFNVSNLKNDIFQYRKSSRSSVSIRMKGPFHLRLRLGPILVSLQSISKKLLQIRPDTIDQTQISICNLCRQDFHSGKRKKVLNESCSQDEVVKEVSIRLADVNDLCTHCPSSWRPDYVKRRMHSCSLIDLAQVCTRTWSELFISFGLTAATCSSVIPTKRLTG